MLFLAVVIYSLVLKLVYNGNCLLASSVSLNQGSLANRKVFRIGLHATASKSSPRKALFSSVQEQSQHQPKDNFLEEHITYQVCLKLMKLK
jgi:hypothetical protein